MWTSANTALYFLAHSIRSPTSICQHPKRLIFVMVSSFPSLSRSNEPPALNSFESMAVSMSVVLYPYCVFTVCCSLRPSRYASGCACKALFSEKESEPNRQLNTCLKFVVHDSLNMRGICIMSMLILIITHFSIATTTFYIYE